MSEADTQQKLFFYFFRGPAPQGAFGGRGLARLDQAAQALGPAGVRRRIGLQPKPGQGRRVGLFRRTTNGSGRPQQRRDSRRTWPSRVVQPQIPPRIGRCSQIARRTSRPGQGLAVSAGS
jgi:hypothetical protein